MWSDAQSILFASIFYFVDVYISKLKLMNDSYLNGVPMVRHLFFNYPNDENIRKVIGEIKDIDNDDRHYNGHGNFY